MSALYWFALVVGAGLLFLSLVGDLFGDHGDGASGDGHDHGGDTEGMKILSMRNATYFLFGFGGAGILLGWVWDRSQPVMTAISAIAVGLISGGISAVAFGYLNRSGSGELERDSAWSGAIGRVLLPLSRDGTGKIIVARSGREHTLLARPFEPDARDPESWQNVIVVEIRHGIALVTPFTSTLEAPELPRLTDNTER